MQGYEKLDDKLIDSTESYEEKSEYTEVEESFIEDTTDTKVIGPIAAKEFLLEPEVTD